MERKAIPLQKRLSFRIESAEDIADEVYLLGEPVWEEIGLAKDEGIEYEPDMGLARHKDLFVCVVGRDSKGEIGALYIGMLTPYMFSVNINYCNHVLIYLRPDFRGTKMLDVLLKYTEQAAKIFDIHILDLGLPIRHDSRLAKALDKRGFKFLETKFYKKL